MAGKKRKRNHNPRLIKGRRTYTFAEIAKIYGAHIRTVHRWTKEGLLVICQEKTPHLVLGADVRRFLQENTKKRRQPLRADEFYCPRCRRPQKSRLDGISVRWTGRKLGEVFKQVIIRGICQACGQSMIRFSSDRKIKDFTAANMTFTEPPKRLTGGEGTSVNADIRKEQST